MHVSVCVSESVSALFQAEATLKFSFLKCVERMKRRDGAAVLTSKGPAACFFMYAFLNCLSCA